MSGWRSVHVLTAGLLLAAAASASELGADLKLHFSADAIARYDFESPAAMAPLMRQVQASGPTWIYNPVTAGALSGAFVSDASAAEGSGYLRFTGNLGPGFTIVDAAAFAAAAGQRIQVSFWGRSEGIEPVVYVTWGNESDISTTTANVWARVPAIRTGRETSDGWAEYSTGPVDGSVLDRPIHDLLLTGRVASTGGSDLLFANPQPQSDLAFSIDALELRPAAGAISSGACTAATVDQACGARGECFYGRCVDSAAKWHPVPPLDQQQQIAQRVVSWMTNFLADRAAVARASAAWVAQTLALASADATPKTFWGGLRRQVNALRDTHTSLGNPYNNISTPFAFFPNGNPGPLDVCFGPTLNDLGDGKLAYVVWKRGPLAPASLQVGDVVAAIDGEDPKTWVDRIYPLETYSLPTVAEADWAQTSGQLGSILAQHAGTLTVARCSPGGSCTLQPPLDVATPSLQATASGTVDTTLQCSVRFSDTATQPNLDNDFLSIANLDARTVAIEFDGFTPANESAWQSRLQDALAGHPANVLVDARVGPGGFLDAGDFMVNLFRGTSSPVVLAVAGRGGFATLDAAPLFFDWSTCLGQSFFTWQCLASYLEVSQTTNSAPPAASSKVAWLNTDDASDNDIVPRMLQGRANLRIFAPFPTDGAFGSVVQLPQLTADTHNGTLAAGDGRVGSSVQAAESQVGWLSGTGVVPDQVATQTLSDVLAGKDTIVSAARDWLAQ